MPVSMRSDSESMFHVAMSLKRQMQAARSARSFYQHVLMANTKRTLEIVEKELRSEIDRIVDIIESDRSGDNYENDQRRRCVSLIREEED